MSKNFLIFISIPLITALFFIAYLFTQKKVSSPAIVDGKKPLTVDEIIADYQKYDGKDVEVKISKLLFESEPKHPKSMACIASSIPPRSCYGSWLYKIEGLRGNSIDVESDGQLVEGETVRGKFMIVCPFLKTAKVAWSAEKKTCEYDDGANGNPYFQIVTLGVSRDASFSGIDYKEPDVKPFKATVRGVFESVKGCMGLLKLYGSNNEILLPEFANRCEEIKKYEGGIMEVYGLISKTECLPGAQCRGGLEVGDIESIKTAEPAKEDKSDLPIDSGILTVDQIVSNGYIYKDKLVAVSAGKVRFVKAYARPDVTCNDTVSVLPDSCFDHWYLDGDSGFIEAIVSANKQIKSGDVIRGKLEIDCQLLPKIAICEWSPKDNRCKCDNEEMLTPKFLMYANGG